MVAVIAALAGVFGALAGGWATYKGNEATQSHQDRASARAVALLYEGEFVDFVTRLEVMQAHRNYIAPSNEPFNLTLDDQKQLAANMKPRDYFNLASAEAALRLFDSGFSELDLREAQAGLRPVLDKEHQRYVAQNIRFADDAIATLARFTRSAVPPH